jgi:hypothetical protein
MSELFVPVSVPYELEPEHRRQRAATAEEYARCQPTCARCGAAVELGDENAWVVVGLEFVCPPCGRNAWAPAPPPAAPSRRVEKQETPSEGPAMTEKKASRPRRPPRPANAQRAKPQHKPRPAPVQTTTFPEWDAFMAAMQQLVSPPKPPAAVARRGRARPKVSADVRTRDARNAKLRSEKIRCTREAAELALRVRGLVLTDAGLLACEDATRKLLGHVRYLRSVAARTRISKADPRSRVSMMPMLRRRSGR